MELRISKNMKILVLRFFVVHLLVGLLRMTVKM